ncbi:MAG: restriction endonuclease subunit S, partial [Deltaproteobacteria bacterium]|nr:restriction endonuclease subunit S [Deltaproteobacteria bacterium]
MKDRNENRPGYRKTKVGWIPENWEFVTLNEIINEKRLGANYENSEKGNGIPLIKMGNIGRGKIKVDKIEHVQSSLDYDKKYILKKGDILFNTRNTLNLVGKVAIWNNELPIALYNSNLLKIEFNKSKIDSSAFANYLLNSQKSLRQLKGMAIGTTSVAAIYDRDLIQLKIPLPTLSEQKKI